MIPGGFAETRGLLLFLLYMFVLASIFAEITIIFMEVVMIWN